MLLEDALGNDLVDLIGDEMRLQLEAGVEPSDERRLEVGAVDHLLEVLLAGDDEPDLALALVARGEYDLARWIGFHESD